MNGKTLYETYISILCGEVVRWQGHKIAGKKINHGQPFTFLEFIDYVLEIRR